MQSSRQWQFFRSCQRDGAPGQGPRFCSAGRTANAGHRLCCFWWTLALGVQPRSGAAGWGSDCLWAPAGAGQSPAQGICFHTLSAAKAKDDYGPEGLNPSRSWFGHSPREGMGKDQCYRLSSCFISGSFSLKRTCSGSGCAVRMGRRISQHVWDL